VKSKDDKTKGSGLFALLPKPKNISETKMEKRPLVPHVLTKKPSQPKPITGSKRPAPVPTSIPSSESDSNFFSLDSAESLPSIKVPLVPAAKKFQVSHPDPEDAPLAFQAKSTSPLSPSTSSETPGYGQMYNLAEMSEQDMALYDEEQRASNLQKLAGSQGVRGKELDDLDIVDVCADDALGGTNEIQENLLRELSAKDTQSYRPQPKKGEGPSSLSKRKHQITYLAFQAKEREQLLKNQWAQSAQTRRQTQAKYGF